MRRGLLLCVLVLAVLAAPARAQVPVGISDQHASALHDPRLQALGVAGVRVVAPWDAALAPSPELDDWLPTARALRLDALVSFERRRGEDCRAGPCRLPTTDELTTAFEAFRARWPWVSTFGRNEPDHPSQPTAAAPAAAARLYETLADLCPGCRILAAEPLDTPDMLTWVRRFSAALSAPPALWGLQLRRRHPRPRGHPHRAAARARRWTPMGDGERRDRAPHGRRRPSALALRRGPCASERGACPGARRPAGGPDRARVPLSVAGRRPRAVDSGRLRPDGLPRPSFDVVAVRLRAAPFPPAPPPTTIRGRPRDRRCRCSGAQGWTAGASCAPASAV